MEDFETIRVGGHAFAFKTEPDDSTGAPWEEHDGHGPVTGWERRNKAPGELILNEDRHGRKRFYDFAAACKIARRDGWGFLPGPLQIARVNGRWATWVWASGWGKTTRPGQRIRRKLYRAESADINAAIRATYAQHRATMTARQYAAGAALSDYERLRGWCQDAWGWCGVIVAPIDEYGPDWRQSESLWGIEDDSPDYHREVATKLAGVML